MNHAQLKAFHAVANKGGFTSAAKHLGLTQPAISLQVQALEQRYQTELFVRRGRAVMLTPCGELLLNISNRIFNLEEEAHLLLTSRNKLNSGMLKIATDTATPTYDLSSAFHILHPNIAISVSTLNSDGALDGLLNYDIDLAILSEPMGSCDVQQIDLVKSPIAAILWRDHPIAAQPRVTLENLAREKFVHSTFSPHSRRQINSAFLTRNLRPEYVMTVESKEGLREAIANQIGIALLPAAEFEHDSRLNIKPVKDLKIETYIRCYYLKERASSQLVKAFTNVIEAGRTSKTENQDAQRTC